MSTALIPIRRQIEATFLPWVLICLLAIGALLAFGGWWLGDELQEGETAQVQNKQLQADLKETVKVIEHQQRVVVESSRQMQAAAQRMDALSQEYAREVEYNRRQQAAIRQQLEYALAARPDLADVRVGVGLLDAWNAANRGRAAGAAGAAQPASNDPPRPAAGRTGRAAAGHER